MRWNTPLLIVFPYDDWGQAQPTGASSGWAVVIVGSSSRDLADGNRSGLRLAHHDRQADRRAAALEEDVAPNLEAVLSIVGVVGERARFKIHGAILGVSL